VRLAPAATRSLGERFIDSGGLPEQNAAHCLAVLTDRERGACSASALPVESRDRRQAVPVGGNG